MVFTISLIVTNSISIILDKIFDIDISITLIVFNIIAINIIASILIALVDTYITYIFGMTIKITDFWLLISYKISNPAYDYYQVYLCDRWLEENCEGKYKISNKHIYFSNISDATMFKLVYDTL